MSFCLDDGAELLFGPASMDEPQTAILSASKAAASNLAGVTEDTVSETAVLQPRTTGAASDKSPRMTKPLVALAAAAVILACAFFGYKYFSPAKQITSIAVMPFVNESGNPDVEYLSDGMTETLIRSLSQLSSLQVKPRSSVFRYKGKETDAKIVGKELNVQGVLNGRMTQRGDEVTLNLELIDAERDIVLWSEQYIRKAADLASLQNEIAKDVSTKLQSRLSGAEEAKLSKASTVDTEAYQAYLKGRYYWNRRTSENIRKAIEQFKLAADRDPNYALAFVGLAECYVVLNEYAGVPLAETAKPAMMYAERAIAIDGSLAEPHATLGAIHQGLWQWAEAEREFKRAIEINPRYPTTYHWYAIMLLWLGRTDEASASIQRAHELDPLSSIINATVAWVQLGRGDYKESIAIAQQLIDLDPNFGIAYQNLGLAYLRTGRSAEALASMEKAAQLTDRWGQVLGNLGYAYAAAGRRTEALVVIKELEDKYNRREGIGLYIAAVYAGLGDKEKAFEWLEKDFENHDPGLPDMTVSIPLSSLRDDRRFPDMLKRMGLPESK